MDVAELVLATILGGGSGGVVTVAWNWYTFGKESRRQREQDVRQRGRDFLDTFLVYNLLGTNQWGSTLSQQLAFSGLNVGVKSAWPDKIVAIITVEREVWILGPYKGEIWYNAGTVPFPFQSLPGVIIEQGCAAKYSVAKMDTSRPTAIPVPDNRKQRVKTRSKRARRSAPKAMRTPNSCVRCAVL